MKKAMILAAGRGERLKPITDKRPKPLVEIAGKPLIEYQILKLKAAGITDIMVNCAWLAEQIVEFLDHGKPWGLTIETSIEHDGALETAGGIINVLDYFDDTPFWVLSSDIYSDVDLTKIKSLDEGKLAHLLLVKNPQHNLSGDFHIEQSGILQSEGPNKFTFASMGLYKKQLFHGLAKGKRPLAPILRDAMNSGSIEGSIIDGNWTDVGTVERLEMLEQQLKKKAK